MEILRVLIYCACLICWMEHGVSAGPTKKVCHYGGRTYEVNDLVTGDVCDECFCTPYGIMCQLRYCPPVDCPDKVLGQCCWECPKEPEVTVCQHTGAHGTVDVPPTGCLYPDGLVCHCYHDNTPGGVGETMCFPPMPGPSMPPCNASATA